MILPVILSAMALLAVAALAWPLTRARKAPPPRSAFERAVLADQMAEIDRDLDRGVIDKREAEAARAEVGRRALARLGGERTPAREDAPAPPARRRRALTAAIVLPVAAGALYVALGRPDLPGQPFAGRPQPGSAATAPAPSAETLATVAAMIAARVREAPSDSEGWRLLMRVYERLGRPDAARRLYEGVRDGAETPAARAGAALGYGEAVTALNDGTVTTEARAAFDEALEAAPDNPAARYYHGLGQMQGGNPQGAYETWTKLLADAPADAPWRARLEADIERLVKDHGVGPTPGTAQ